MDSLLPNERKLRRAKKYVCGCVAAFIDPRNGHDNVFLRQNPDGSDATPEDREYNEMAMAILMQELIRRAR